MELTTRFGLNSQTTRLWGRDAPPEPAGTHTGLSPSAGPRSRGLWAPGRAGSARRAVPHATALSRSVPGRFGDGLLPLHSPLLGESLLVSFPPLIDMLKFRGWSRPNSGRAFAVAAAPPRRGGFLRRRLFSLALRQDLARTRRAGGRPLRSGMPPGRAARSRAVGEDSPPRGRAVPDGALAKRAAVWDAREGLGRTGPPRKARPSVGWGGLFPSLPGPGGERPCVRQPSTPPCPPEGKGAVGRQPGGGPLLAGRAGRVRPLAPLSPLPAWASPSARSAARGLDPIFYGRPASGVRPPPPRAAPPRGGYPCRQGLAPRARPGLVVVPSRGRCPPGRAVCVRAGESSRGLPLSPSGRRSPAFAALARLRPG